MNSFRSPWAKTRPAALFVAAVVLGLLTGCAMIPPPRAAWNLVASAPAPNQERTAYNLSVYDNVWDWVDRCYYDATFNGVDWNAAKERHRAAAGSARNDDELYTAINRLLGELKDRHTSAMTAPKFTQAFHPAGGTLGMRVEGLATAPDGRWRVFQVFKKGPAYRAGVREGWYLLTCNGQSQSLREFLQTKASTVGQVVRCEFLTDKDEFRTIDLTVVQMPIPFLRAAQMLPEGVLVVRFDRFDLPSVRWFHEQMVKHRDAKALVIDLRRNRGGHVFAEASALSEVFPKPVDMGKITFRNEEAFWHRCLPQFGGARYQGPIVVLVSRGTMSAAEIFAQVVHDHHRGFVVGEKTAGTVLTAVFWPLPGNGKLYISVYDYHSPNGRRLEGNGVELDKIVASSSTANEDAGLQAALEILRPALQVAR